MVMVAQMPLITLKWLVFCYVIKEMFVDVFAVSKLCHEKEDIQPERERWTDRLLWFLLLPVSSVF